MGREWGSLLAVLYTMFNMFIVYFSLGRSVYMLPCRWVILPVSALHFTRSSQVTSVFGSRLASVSPMQRTFLFFFFYMSVCLIWLAKMDIRMWKNKIYKWLTFRHRKQYFSTHCSDCCNECDYVCLHYDNCYNLY